MNGNLDNSRDCMELWNSYFSQAVLHQVIIMGQAYTWVMGKHAKSRFLCHFVIL